VGGNTEWFAPNVLEKKSQVLTSGTSYRVTVSQSHEFENNQEHCPFAVGGCNTTRIGYKVTSKKHGKSETGFGTLTCPEYVGGE